MSLNQLAAYVIVALILGQGKSTTTRIAGGLDSPEKGRQGARSAKLPSATTAEGGGFYADKKQPVFTLGRNHTSQSYADIGGLWLLGKNGP
jgi:hypothetical protein